MMNPFLQVALGGAIGATARYAVYRAIAWHGPGFPIATGLVNVLGSFAMGLLAAFMAHRWHNHYAPFLLTGVLGGFTTFSAFSLDALTLWERGQMAGTIIYVAVSVVLSLFAVTAGLVVGRGLFA
ncbi:fluoride efflux transporter CrcB [Paracoccus alkanivorans]|uniref:Fluoride-specific ion channel FluC n=1 Tax=Paracoccus alkanivorans TaxID=2116655 RepID=A0A3M0MM06_9RHOB|nr:fluoride efflux transporter CrcB [Paracoccus alkanivorans]RMC37334.1 fluoride efflux transporter CrcB [Paracoccus alkanivorans]